MLRNVLFQVCYQVLHPPFSIFWSCFKVPEKVVPDLNASLKKISEE